MSTPRKATKPLPRLIDARIAMDETGLSRSLVMRIMRQCDPVQPIGVRRILVRRDEFEAALMGTKR